MDIVGAYDAKTHLPKLLERITKGESIIITKYGVPVAVLQPFPPEKKGNTESIISELRKFRDNINAKSSELSIRQMIEIGRR